MTIYRLHLVRNGGHTTPCGIKTANHYGISDFIAFTDMLYSPTAIQWLRCKACEDDILPLEWLQYTEL